MDKSDNKTKELYEADFVLNRNVFKVGYYSTMGLSVGLAAIFFFKGKKSTVIFMTGLGTGYGLNDFRRDLNAYRPIPKPLP